MDLPTQQHGNVTIVRLPPGHLHAGNVPEFRDSIAPLLDAHLHVVIDMSQLTLVDSSGLGALIACLRHISERNGELRLFGLSGSVLAVFKLMRMHRVFTISETEQAAIDSMLASREGQH